MNAGTFQLLISGICFMLVGGCDMPPSAPSVTQDNTRSAAPDDVKRRQADLLNRIRDADPEHRTIERAMINQDNELGLILGRSVEMDRIPDLMRSILTQMAREFPGQDLTVLAYTPSSPPHKIGTATLRAQTGEMAYTPSQ